MFYFYLNYVHLHQKFQVQESLSFLYKSYFFIQSQILDKNFLYINIYLHFLNSLLLDLFIKMINRTRRLFYLLDSFSVAKGKSSLKIQATWQVYGTMRKTFLNVVSIPLAFSCYFFLRLLCLFIRKNTNPVSYSYPPGPGVIERF